MDAEYFGTSPKKGRGRAEVPRPDRRHVYGGREAAQPITGRGIGYKLFTTGMIPSMARMRWRRSTGCSRRRARKASFLGIGLSMRRGNLSRCRAGMIRPSSCAQPADPIAENSGRSSRFASRCGAEKGTVRGVFSRCSTSTASASAVMHGFSSATSIYDIAQDDDGRVLIALYVGDYDPSGMFMSESDLPETARKIWWLSCGC